VWLRFDTLAKQYQNLNIFWHSGKLYATYTNYLLQEVDISTLESLDYWDVNGAWDRPFTSHPDAGEVDLNLLHVTRN